MRTTTHRDPFARTTTTYKPTETKEACAWCGCQPKNGKQLKITIEQDGTRNNKHEIKGAFCSRSCAASYHG